MTQAAPRTPARTARPEPSARGAIVFACLAMAVILGLDLWDGSLDLLYSVGFCLIVVTAPLSVDARGLFATGVLPPLLMVLSLFAVCLFNSSAIQVSGMDPGAGTVARLIAATIDHGWTLAIGEALALAAIGLRVLGDPAR
ncbi:DUF6542 domain-containing protein [Aeromicrobium wangtongii]|uniref:DUF6542 domain-containing protein n=1 Tax=Aeromicrobium wangtongii TaxID=2969247 RepID=A0ABY5M8Q3_9ACTN|nr:DUF6542 domain-containing protein [Aeromicrobium wangtongii]MCD9197012.1 hypothetical protein [Aeromicrobium wangtongii]UUP14513.1 hypothetical protein NQV15_04160 [Aeromicrobium wangtongii]